MLPPAKTQRIFANTALTGVETRTPGLAEIPSGKNISAVGCACLRVKFCAAHQPYILFLSTFTTCEVRAKQYWRLEKLNSFDEFLAKRFPESRRKAYYLMTIHEHLTRAPKPRLQEIGGRRQGNLSRWRAEMGRSSLVHPGCTRPTTPEGTIQTRGGTAPYGRGNRALGDHLFQAL